MSGYLKQIFLMLKKIKSEKALKKIYDYICFVYLKS